MSVAEVAKDAGDAAYREKNFSEGIFQYSKAISDGGAMGSDWLKKVYSNRSAVHSLNLNYPYALSDAQKCIELDSEWVKGYARKGDCCFCLRKWDDSIAAYERASNLAPALEKASYKSKLDAAVKARDREASASGNKLVSVILPVTGTIRDIHSKLTSYTLIAFVVHFLPLRWIPVLGSYIPPSLNSMAYTVFALISIVKVLMEVYFTIGRPTMSMAYAFKVMTVEDSHLLLLSTLLFGNRPYLLAMLPIVLHLAVSNVSSIVNWMLEVIPQIKSVNLIKFKAELMLMLDNVEQGLKTPQVVHLMSEELGKLGATCEVMQGIVRMSVSVV